jgi:hypothetical protein
MRPGHAPLDELARALAAPEALGAPAARLRDTIGRTSLGLLNAVQEVKLSGDENVLLVVDQFEELFRFERERRHQDGGAEASLFVESLLEAADAYAARIFVVITMRSDYLAQCAQFGGLPEALNRGQYLIPHLTREQRREAIEKPPLFAGARIKPALAQQLLNDMGEDPGQLPVLQHALMRTFGCMRESGERELDFEDYARAGGLAHALDRHADTIVAQLPAGPRGWVEKLFRTLTTVEGGRAVRRPARLDRIYDVLDVDTDAAMADIRKVIEAFAERASSLLVSSTGLVLRADSVIDISHESLIRNWRQLHRWLQEETRSAEWFLSLAGDTLRYRAGEASLWRDPELARVVQLRQEARWNEAWAKQYLPEGDPPYAEVTRFVEESVLTQRKEREQKEAQRRKEIEDAQALAASSARAKKFYRLFMWTFVSLLVGASLFVWYAWRAHEKEKAAAEVGLALSKRLSDLTAEQEAVMQQLRTAAQLQKAQTSGQEDPGLRNRITELENRLNTSKVASNNTRQQLQQSVNASGPEYSTALKQVADLEGQLKRTREERDALQSRVDALAAAPSRDASYWKTRAETAEANVGKLQAGPTPGFAAPVVVALPPYSSVRLDSAPFSGRAHLFVADIGRVSPWAVYVVLPKSRTGLQEFTRNEQAATEVSARLPRRDECPTYQDASQQSVWCFSVEKSAPTGYTQQLGQFRFGSTTFTVVASGAVADVRSGGTDVMTLVIYPEPRAPASAK